jgi:hypothetical protein
MNKPMFAIMLPIALASCGRRPEFPPETIAAYQSDDTLRNITLQKCGSHAINHKPFSTQSDTEECQKAAEAQGNLNYAAHVERERQANDRLATEINGSSGSASILEH